GIPLDEAQLTCARFDNRRAALDPVTAVQIVDIADAAVGGVMNVPTDNTVGTMPAGFACDGFLIGANERHGLLDAVLEVGREGPVPEAEVAANPVQGIVEPECGLVSPVPEEGEP